MVGHKLGEFAPTRTFIAHTSAEKKAAQEAAAASLDGGKFKTGSANEKK